MTSYVTVHKGVLRVVHLTKRTVKGRQRIKAVARIFPKGPQPKRYPRLCCSALNETCGVCYRWPWFTEKAIGSPALAPLQRENGRLKLRR